MSRAGSVNRQDPVLRPVGHPRRRVPISSHIPPYLPISRASQATGYLPISPHISPYLPISPHISPYLLQGCGTPESDRTISPYLPISPHISPYLPISRIHSRVDCGPAGGRMAHVEISGAEGSKLEGKGGLRGGGPRCSCCERRLFTPVAVHRRLFRGAGRDAQQCARGAPGQEANDPRLKRGASTRCRPAGRAPKREGRRRFLWRRCVCLT